MGDWLTELEEENKERKRKAEEEKQKSEHFRRSRKWYWRLLGYKKQLTPSEQSEQEKLELYKRNKKELDRIYGEVIRYVARVKELTGADISAHAGGLGTLWLEGPCGEVGSINGDNNVSIRIREMKISVMSVDAIRVEVYQASEAGLYGYFNDACSRAEFHVQFDTFSNKHVSSWVRWVATGEGKNSIGVEPFSWRTSSYYRSYSYHRRRNA